MKIRTTEAAELEQILNDDEAICPHCGAERGRDRPDGCRDPQCPTMGDAA